MEVEHESFSNPWTRDMYDRELANPDRCHVYVLRVPFCRVAGFCAFWMVVGELHLNNVAMRPVFRGRGLGTILIHHALMVAAKRGTGRATLEVRASNERARRLYERLGFRLTGIRRGYYSHPREDACIYWYDPIDGAL